MSDYAYQKKITCPWCDYEFVDSWECGEAGMLECYGCGKEFEFEQDVEVSYSSWKPPVLVRRSHEALSSQDGLEVQQEPMPKSINRNQE